MTRLNPFSRQYRLPLAAGIVALALPALGADDEEREPYGVSIRLGGLALFNAKASLIDTRPVLGGAGNFDDGFVLPGINGTGAGKKTWNWGYQNESQIVGDQIELHRLDDSPRVGSFDLSGDNPALGGELVMGFEAFRFDLGKREARFGVELGYGYAPFSASGVSSRTANAKYTTSRFNLNGVIPPVPPYAGTFEGPGPLIDLNAASETTETSTGTSQVASDFDVTIHALRFGLWIEYPLTERLALTASVGYSALYADGELQVTESLTFVNPAVPSMAAATATASKTDWLQGAYFQTRISWKFTENWSVYIGGEARWQTDFLLETPGRRGELEFGVGFGAVAGVEFSF